MTHIATWEGDILIDTLHRAVPRVSFTATQSWDEDQWVVRLTMTMRIRRKCLFR